MLFICGQSFISGGEFALKTLLQNLDKKDPLFLICHNSTEIKKFFEIPNVVIVGCPYFHSLSSLKKKYGMGAYILKALSLLSFLIFFFRVILMIKPKVIISNNFSEIPASLFAFIFRIPFIQYIHEVVQKNSRNYKTIKFFEKFISKFIFVSNASKNAVISILPEDKIAVVYNSVDLYNEILPKGINLLPLKMLFVGMINDNKNPLRFLSWIKILSADYQVSAKIIYHLYEDALLSECQAFAKNNKLNVEWIKNPDQNTITNDIKNYHFMCSTSFYEAQPLTVLNAMSLGTPTISSQNVGVPEIIRDGYTGVIISDDSGLSEKIRPYLQQDNYKKMSENCLNESLKFSHKNKIDKFLDALKGF